MSRWVALGAVTATAIALGATAFSLWPRAAWYYTDADSIRQPVSAASPRDVLWQPPQRLSEVLNTRDQDYEPRPSWDGLTMFFVRGKAGENADIFVSQRTPGGWTPAARLDAVNSDADDLGPAPTMDGQSLYFYSNRDGGAGGYDLWVSRREGDGWQAPTNLGAAVNSPFNDYSPAPSADGRTLYFASNRPPISGGEMQTPSAWPATVREDLQHRTYDIYEARHTDAGFAPPRPIAALNTPANEGAVCVSPLGDFLYFSSDRPGGRGGFDLYRARRVGDDFRTPENLGAPINTAANELDPGLTALGYALVFSSDRPLMQEDSASPIGAPDVESQRRSAPPPDYDLYYSASREVFRESESRPIEWSALLRAIGPSLAWLLLGLLALLLLLRFMGDVRRGKLSLLARCLLASLIVHLLLLIGTSFWRVTAGVVGALREGGGREIRVSVGGGADGIAAQIRGQATDRVQLAADFTPVSADLQVAVPGMTPQSVELASYQVRPEPLPAHVTPSDAPADAQVRPTFQPVALESSASATWRVPSAAPLATETESPTPEPAAMNAPARATQIAVSDAAASVALRSIDVASETRDPSVERAAGSLASNEPFHDAATAAGPPRPAFATGARSLAADSSVSATSPNLRLPTPGDPTAVGSAETAAGPIMQAASGAPPESLTPSAPPGSPMVAMDIAGDSGAPTLASQTSLSNASAIGASSGSANSSAGSAGRRPLRGLLEDIGSNATSATITTTRLPAAPISGTNGNSPVGEASVAPMPVAAGGSATPPEFAAAGSPGAHSPRFDAPVIEPSEAAGAGAAIKSLADSNLSSIGSDVGVSSAPRVAQADRRSLDRVLDDLPVDLKLPLGAGAAAGSTPQEIVGSSDGDAARGDVSFGGVLRGRVVDARSKEPIGGATVRLDRLDGPDVAATSDIDGRYELPISDVPDFFAVTAVARGYLPRSENVSAATLRRHDATLDFGLSKRSANVIAVEAQPEVHHLGNDRFEGRINSQFQKRSEGRVYLAEFTVLATHQLDQARGAELSLLVKGAQCPQEVRINGEPIDIRLDQAPPDGSFGRVRGRFPSQLLVEGVNRIEIETTECHGDLDDFEFVNVQVRLIRR
ncbi:MAG: hypothetical protein U1D55_15785 [Phycisphaerae bacterium]